MDKLKAFYRDKIGKNRFIYSIFPLCVLGDFLHLLYAKNVGMTKEMFDQMFLKALMSAPDIDVSALSQQDIAEGSMVMYSTLWTTLYGMVFCHAIIYFLSTKGKVWAINYMKFVVYTSMLITAIGSSREMLTPDIWTLSNLVQLVLYTYLSVGLLTFDIKTPEGQI
jgi:hypothetical protein